MTQYFFVILSTHRTCYKPLSLELSIAPCLLTFQTWEAALSHSEEKGLWNRTALLSVQFSSVAQSSLTLCAACQASLSITNSQSFLKLMSIESVMPSSHLILCCPLLLLPPIPPSIRVFSSESTLRIRWPEYWSFSFSIHLYNEHRGLISFRMDWLDLLAVQGLSRICSNTTVQKHWFFGTQLSSQSNSHIHTWPLEKL